MKPYGVDVISHPDVADIQEMGAKSSVGRYPGKGGDYRGYSNGNGKRKARIRWKRKARQKVKREIRNWL